MGELSEAICTGAEGCNSCRGPCHRYRLHFERDSREEVEKRKRAAREQVLPPVSAEMLELDIQEVYQPGSGAGALRPLGRPGLGRGAGLTEEGGLGRTWNSSHCLDFS